MLALLSPLSPEEWNMIFEIAALDEILDLFVSLRHTPKGLSFIGSGRQCVAGAYVVRHLLTCAWFQLCL